VTHVSEAMDRISGTGKPCLALDGVVDVVVAGDAIPLLADLQFAIELAEHEKGRAKSPSMTNTLAELAIR
jgi:hypothetical protein